MRDSGYRTTKQILLTDRYIILLMLSLFVSCHGKKVDFNADVRPILNKNCLPCHGGVKKNAGFGLVFREEALQKTENGNFVIVPGHPDQSEMIARIRNTDPEQRMPLDKEPLTGREIEILTRWIRQGANWEQHWAYLLPEKHSPPRNSSKWPRNEIDQFVLQKMKAAGLAPSGEAQPHELIRRLSFDITGLPPTEEQYRRFVSAPSESVYESLVDEMLSSPSYGEHWTSMWLDLARYADSKGYEKDSPREIWKYRDWVIQAFNKDMPFDTFTLEQLAGDLMSEGGIDPLIATAFNRNTLTNDEGGSDNEEYRTAAVIDRNNTVWETWQATTMACAQCHSHPYDPIVQKDFYKSYAFFNQSNDWDSPRDSPLLKELNQEDSTTLAQIKAWISTRYGEKSSKEIERFVRTTEPRIQAEDFEEMQGVQYFNRGDQNEVFVYDKSVVVLKERNWSDVEKFYLHYRSRTSGFAELTIRSGDMSGPVVGRSSLKAHGNGFQMIPVALIEDVGSTKLYFEFRGRANGENLGALDGILPFKRLQASKDPEHEKILAGIDGLMNAVAVTSTPVLIDKSPENRRRTQIFERGNWLVKTEEVHPGVPDVFQTRGRNFTNRLDLAEWLVSKENPLTRRVIVNRLWGQIFGRGIVETAEDFGTLGAPPSHPELLDFLAVHFADDFDWSLKKMIKMMVMSSSYRQSSVVQAEKYKKDPDNKWLARSSRLRLTAEQIRDQSLAVSGLLSAKMYGVPVMPPQPEGVWSVVYSDYSWQTSPGEDARRRALYTYLRRSSPYPSFAIYDASDRNVCLSRRVTTNTPLQALVSLNDPVYLEAAQQLALALREIKRGDKDLVQLAYSKIMTRPITEARQEELVSLLQDARQFYHANREEACRLTGEEDENLAALLLLFNSLMNTDEFLVKN